MTEWIIASSVLIAVIAAQRFILRGKVSLRLQYALWALVLIRLLVPVSFGVSTVSVMNAIPAPLPETVLPVDVPAGANNIPAGVTPEISFPALPENAGVAENVQNNISDAYIRVIDWGFVALVVWITGLTAVALFLFIANLRFSIRLKSDRRRVDIPGFPLPVYVSEMVETPCMFGLFPPAIYVTQEVLEDEKTLHHVLEHEATHYRHGDPIWAILRCVCLALHWYNPLVWLAASLSKRDAELACDEGTIKRIGEESRGDYGRSLVGLTCKKHTASTLLITSTTMTGSKKGIKERVVLIAKKPKTAIGTLVGVIIVAAVAVGGTFTGAEIANDVGDFGEEAGPSYPDASVSPAASGTNAYNIPMDAVSFYGPHGIQPEPAVDESDIKEILAEAESSGMKMLFYRAYSGDIWGAWVKEDGSVHRFIHAYDKQEQWGYESGFSVELFRSLFGREGFVMGYSLGASYHAYDYYFLNDGGDVELLAGCTNNHTVLDLDGDGNSELLYFSYVNAGLAPYFYLKRENGLYQADVTSLLQDTFPGWRHIRSDGSVSRDEDGPYLSLTFRLGEEETEYTCRVRYAHDALVVEDVPENASPDRDIWLVRKDGYEVGLRNQSAQTEILMRRDGVVTVLGSVPSGFDTGMRYSLRSFDAIPELSGFVLEHLTGYGWGNFFYYAVQNDSAFCFAQSFGWDRTDIAEDLDGDGQSELICNVTYGADGVRSVMVYRMKEGIPQVASVKDAMLSLPEDKTLAGMASAVYDGNTGAVTLEYMIRGEDDLRVETAPIDYDSLQFENFTAEW